MSKPTCLVTAPVATRSGYGAHMLRYGQLDGVTLQ